MVKITMENLTQKIVEYIRKNKVSTTEVADCLGKSGALKDIYPINSGMFKAGKIRYIYAHSESNWSIHEQAREVEENEIVLVDGINVDGRALFGELVTKFITLYMGAEAIVAMGNVRDANDMIKQKYPVWTRGTTPVGCFNRNVEETDEVCKIANESKLKYDGAIAVCDDTGVVVIPKSEITEEFLNKLQFIEKQEDMWFECIDRRKWNTYDTVCLRKYRTIKAAEWDDNDLISE